MVAVSDTEMERNTVRVYEGRARPRHGREARPARFLDGASDRWSARVDEELPVADLGCGAGLHLPYLPRPAVALDAAHAWSA